MQMCFLFLSMFTYTDILSVIYSLCSLSEAQQLHAPLRKQFKSEATLGDRCVYSPVLISTPILQLLVNYLHLLSSSFCKEGVLKRMENFGLNFEMEKMPFEHDKHNCTAHNYFCLHVCGCEGVCPGTAYGSAPDRLTLITGKCFCWMEEV